MTDWIVDPKTNAISLPAKLILAGPAVAALVLLIVSLAT